MKQNSYSRQIGFQGILNFRDLGGYPAAGGRTVAWRRLFRSGELHNMTKTDIIRLKEEIRLTSVIDLRSFRSLERLGVGSLDDLGARYYHLPLDLTIQDADEKNKALYQGFDNPGESYLFRVKRQEFSNLIIEALEIIADSTNHPLLFHCNAGKDRSGILAAIILGVLGVPDDDIIADYILTAAYMPAFIDRWNQAPRTAHVYKNQELLAFDMVTSPESMAWFLSALRREYGSVRGYLEAHGAEVLLVNRLEKALLV